MLEASLALFVLLIKAEDIHTKQGLPAAWLVVAGQSEDVAADAVVVFERTKSLGLTAGQWTQGWTGPRCIAS